MLKKILFAIVVFALLTSVAGVFLVYKYKQTQRSKAARQTTKASDAKFTIIEGWTISDIADALASGKGQPSSTPLALRKDFLKAEASFDTGTFPILKSKPAKADLQGFLFPDTYFVPEKNSSSTTVSQALIKKALNNFEQKFTPSMQTQAQKLGMSIFQVVTLASVIEKETGRNTITAEQKQALDEERKTIAGIFYNRLNAGMPLQSDATVNYVTGKKDPQALETDTKVDSPYNTYQHAGLPPGPIANPSLSSLMATLYPTKTDYFYFLHDQKTGQAAYAQNYDEHLRNKAKYLK